MGNYRVCGDGRVGKRVVCVVWGGEKVDGWVSLLRHLNGEGNERAQRAPSRGHAGPPTSIAKKKCDPWSAGRISLLPDRLEHRPAHPPAHLSPFSTLAHGRPLAASSLGHLDSPALKICPRIADTRTDKNASLKKEGGLVAPRPALVALNPAVAPSAAGRRRHQAAAAQRRTKSP